MQSPSTERVFVYSVDADNQLDSVSSDWLSFARENQASHLNADTVIDQPLFHFVTGWETQQLYKMIFDRVRHTRRRVVIPFRCDSPSLRRFMELVVSPCADGHLQLTGRLVRQEEREPVPLFDSSVSRTQDFIVVCSWCKRVEVSERWLDVELALRQLELFNETCLPQISHGICAECMKRVELEIDQAD